MPPLRRRSRLLAAAFAAALGLAGCGDRTEGPSLLVFVMDTTRADAVSAHGAVEGTTPHLDALAADGIRYRHARSQAPWTLPSHASLFTGRLPRTHRVDWAHPHASDELVMLAERLRDAGFDTMGVSENAWIHPSFGMTQGFDRFHAGLRVSVEDEIADWLGGRDPERPFFLFVNVLDAHAPYTVRAENPWLPEGVGAGRARWVPQAPREYLCARESREEWIAILRGLYLGDVRAADAKLGAVLGLLEGAGVRDDLRIVVTADHGELFGEHDLVSHQFSVLEPLLRVPLVVHGVPGARGVVVDPPVALLDLVPTVLDWIGLPVPDDLPGRTLPAANPAAPAPRTMVAEYTDPAAGIGVRAPRGAHAMRRMSLRMRERCPPEAPVFGSMRSVFRSPLKLVWSEGEAPRLYDLAADPGETRDLAPQRVAAVRELAAELEVGVASAPPATAGGEASIPDDVLEQLEALGYVSTDEEGAAEVAVDAEPDQP